MVGDVAEDDVAAGEVAGAGVAGDGFPVTGEAAALFAELESVFLGCGATAVAGAAVAGFGALSGTSLEEVGGGAGAATVVGATLEGGVALVVLGDGADRFAAAAKWMAAAIPPAASTARSAAATIHGVRDGSFSAVSGNADERATVGALTAAEALTVLTAREWPDVVSR
jgi:hypothetical protein